MSKQYKYINFLILKEPNRRIIIRRFLQYHPIISTQSLPSLLLHLSLFSSRTQLPEKSLKTPPSYHSSTLVFTVSSLQDRQKDLIYAETFRVRNMDRRVFDDRRRIGTVKAAINSYGERILESSSSLKKSHIDLPESSSSTRELHKAKRDMGRYRESRRAAESAKAKAESELSTAKKTVKDLASQIEESNAKVKEQMRGMEALRKSRKYEDDKALVPVSVDGQKYAKVMRELDHLKQELSKLKLDMASVKEDKRRAEKEIEGGSVRLLMNSSSVDGIRKEIDRVNEEQVLVELARIEALKEYGEIEAEREKEASRFSFKIKETKKKMKDIGEEAESSKALESRLAITLFDVNVLQNELKAVKDMERKVQKTESSRDLGGSSRRDEEPASLPMLKSIAEELEEAKSELASIREEGFQFMASMDIIRNELKHVTAETTRLKKTEAKADLTVQNLNSKLLRAKARLESVAAAEEKAKSIVTNLSLNLEQLKTETEVAKKEKELIGEENAKIRAEIQKTESEIDFTEERLQAAMQELEAAKASEALALENLQNLIDNTMRSRASASQYSSSITISKFEYDYLTARAVGAEEIADKKVAASQAWIEALKASEKEILMKIDLGHREIRETRVEEEQEVYRTERSLSAKRKVEGEIKNWRQKSEKIAKPQNIQMGGPRRSKINNANLTPTRRGKHRNSASPAIRATPRTAASFTIKKKQKVMPNLGKLFTNKRIDRDK